MSKPLMTPELIAGWTVKLGILHADSPNENHRPYTYQVSKRAQMMIAQRGFTSPETKGDMMRLVVRSVADLGFKKGAEYQNICMGVALHGYHLCPPEIGFRIRRLFINHPEGLVLRVAMTPIAIPTGEKCIYILDCYKGMLRLREDEMRLDDFYKSRALFIVALPPRLLLPRPS